MAKRKTLSVSGLLGDKCARVKTLRKEIVGLKKNKDNLGVVLAATAPVQRLATNVWASPECYEWDGGVHMTICCQIKVDSLKGPEMAAILAAAEAIYGLEARATQDWVSENFAERAFSYRGIISGVTVNLRIEAQLPTDGAACRRVQIGTEIKEVAKYAIACD
jgi:hypothetical protein